MKLLAIFGDKEPKLIPEKRINPNRSTQKTLSPKHTLYRVCFDVVAHPTPATISNNVQAPVEI